MRKLLLFTILGSCLSIQAQEQTDTIRHQSLDEVVVTSVYKKQNSINTELKSDVIRQRNYGQEPSNMFIKMPSIISLNDNGTEFGYGYFRIRGLDQTRINVSLDGCPWNEAEDYGSYFANSPDLLSSMSSVSVERGSSSLYNGIAGVAGGIILESVNIFKEDKSSVTMDGGSHGSFRGSVIYNMGERNGWGLHVKATHQETCGYRDNSDNSSQAVTIKTGYKFNQNHSLDFMTMNGYHENGQGWIGSTKAELDNDPYANGCLPSEDDNWFMTMNRLQYKGWLSDNTLISSSLYYQHQTGSYRMDLDNYMRKMVDKSWNPTFMLYDYGLTHHMYGANVLLKQSFNELKINCGINAYRFFRNHYLKQSSPNVLVSEFYDNRGTKNDFSSFAQVSYTLDGLTLSGNVQYRYVDFRYRDYLNPELSFSPDLHDTKWNFINYGFSADYQVSENGKVYVSYSHVNREPTRSDMFGGNETYMGELSTIQPEKANDVEAGFTYRNPVFHIGLNYFYMWFDNELVLNGQYGLNGLPCHENAKESYRTGLELSGGIKFTEKLSLEVNGSKSIHKVKSETFGSRNHILSPEWTLDTDFIWKGDFSSAGLNVNYHSDMFIDMENKFKVPHLFTVNLYGETEVMEDMFITLRLNNILNRTNYNTAMIGADNEIRYIQNAGFNFNVSLKMMF